MDVYKIKKRKKKLFGTLENVTCRIVTGDRGDCLIQVRFAVHKETEIWGFDHLIEV